MSIKVLSYVWEHSRHRRGRLLIMLAIADYAHDDGSGAYPSIPALARKGRMSVANVYAELPILVTSGELKIDRGIGPKGTNHYAITMPTPPEPRPLQNLDPSRFSDTTPPEPGYKGRGSPPLPPSPNRKEEEEERIKTFPFPLTDPDRRELEIQYPALSINQEIERFTEHWMENGGMPKRALPMFAGWLENAARISTSALAHTAHKLPTDRKEFLRRYGHMTREA